MFNHTRQTLKHSLALNLRRLKYGRPEAKVFCVGMQKTGTTSLQYALSLLGYRVAGVFTAKDLTSPDQMWERAQELLPAFDAFGDNPWCIYFRELDRIAPGSRFILTTREPEKWYGSVCKHFGGAPTRMREWIYGAAEPIGNRDAYVEKLVSHQDAVRRYFADRPGDFMEFDVTAGDGWDKLCGFLGKRVPRTDFPKLNTADMRT